MKLNIIIQYIVIFSLFIAMIGTGYIFIVTIIFKNTTYYGFYTNWQFPMLLAIFIDAVYYKHINRLKN